MKDTKMEEKSKVEQFEEGLLELLQKGEVVIEPYIVEDEPVKNLMEQLDPDPDERKEMERIYDDYASDQIDAFWDQVEDDLKERVARYGGNVEAVHDCMAFYREHEYAEDSIFEGDIDFVAFPHEVEHIYWGYYFRFFPDQKVPEGMSTYDFLKTQYELLRERESAFDRIGWFLLHVSYRIIELRYGNHLSAEDQRAIYWANNRFRDFYPEFIAAFKEASTATKERAKEIAGHYLDMESRTKSTARRLLKVTPELVVPDNISVQFDSPLNK